MPEGPEIFKTSAFINAVCAGRTFGGKVIKSLVNWKNPPVIVDFDEYSISSDSRGKELMVTLSSYNKNRKKNVLKCVNLLFHFGMSGKFTFTTADDLDKHAHLMFFTKKENRKPRMVLSFVDPRRFGRWQLTDAWSADRGPDPIKEPDAFKRHVLDSLDNKIFSKAICEVLLNQKYFNGIGNYLRAEILYRASIPPFRCARDVLKELSVKNEGSSYPDVLDLCHSVAQEVILLRENSSTEDASVEEVKYGSGQAFMSWLRCYSQPTMNNRVDHDGRTIWFQGVAGPLAPTGGKSRGKKRKTEDDASLNLKTEDDDAKHLKDKKSQGTKQKTKKIPSKDIKSEPAIKTEEEDEIKASPGQGPGTKRSKRVPRKREYSSIDDEAKAPVIKKENNLDALDMTARRVTRSRTRGR